MVPRMDDDIATIIAVEFISKTLQLPEVIVHPDHKIAEQNREIAEQKIEFEHHFIKTLERIKRRKRSLSECQATQNLQRKTRRNRSLSEEEIQTEQAAVAFISWTYSLEECPENADPDLMEQNRLIAEQKRAFEKQTAEEESKSTGVKVRPNYQKFAGELRKEELVKVKTREHKKKKVFIKENLSEDERSAIDLISNSIALTEDSIAWNPEIAEQNRKIAEQKKLFEERVARKKERHMKTASKVVLSDEDIKAEQDTIAFISRSYLLEYVAIHLDPVVVQQNRLIAEQKNAYESQAAKKEDNSKPISQ